ncbi:MAG: hypothetical protein GY849_04175 [Deltaproteobacteria bacterium]|nr:hypothetical protein [Deltaproteobacteria bacterium]
MKRFSVGGFYMKKKELYATLTLLERNPYWLMDDVVIGSVFGSFPNAVWAGGRPHVPGPNPSLREMKNTISYFNGKGMGIRYTFSNSLIQEEHLSDYYCNLLLSLAYNEKNGVIVNAPILEKYVREKYPKLTLIGSITMNKEDIQILKKKQEKVDLLVPSTRLNRDLDKLKELDPDKLEIIVNEVCYPDCPYMTEHYKTISLANLNYDPLMAKDFCFKKHKGRENRFELCLDHAHIQRLHNEVGITHFKLSGRSQTTATYINFLSEYLIKRYYRANFLKEVYLEMEDLDDDNIYPDIETAKARAPDESGDYPKEG